MDEEDVDARSNVIDSATGFPKVLNKKCETCIFRTNSTMTKHIGAHRKDDIEQAALENDSWIVCHSTLPAAGVEVGDQAICRGFWDVHKWESFGCRLAINLGGPVFVDEESKSE